MKVKRLIEILKTKDQESDIQIVVNEYEDLDDTRGTLEEYDLEGVKEEHNKVKLFCTYDFNLET